MKSTGGDSALGGDDFNRAIAHHLLQTLGLPDDAGGDARLARRALDAARAVKEGVTTAETADATLVTSSNGSSHTAKVTLSRAEMEALVQPVLDRCATPVRRALKDAGLDAAALSGVILVGGATRMPLVQRFVAGLFGRAPLAEHQSGSGRRARRSSAGRASWPATARGTTCCCWMWCRCRWVFETMGGVVEKLVPRNSTIPCGATQTFTTYADKHQLLSLRNDEIVL